MNLRKSLPIAMLLAAAIACGPLGAAQTPTGDEQATSAATPGTELVESPEPTPTATPTPFPDVGYPWLIVPVQAFRVMDDDGGREAQISARQFGLWVDHANEIFTSSGIHFQYDPEQDFSTLQSTLLNNMTGIDDPNWIDEILYGDNIAAQYPGKLMVFIRHGPGSAPTGGGFSWFDYNFIAMGMFNSQVCGYQNIGMLAHEIGHYLGLPHTFAHIFGSQQEAETFYIDHGYDANVFDGDGIADTPPDPYVDTVDIQCQPVASLTLAGTSLTLPRENIMSYYEVRSGLSSQQTNRARWLLGLRMQNGMAMPTNRNAQFAHDADSLSVQQSIQCSSARQEMTPFGLQQWYEGDQLFVAANNTSCLLELTLPVNAAGRYALSLYMTKAPDFGQVRVSLNGSPLADLIDTYAPVVIPSGAISLGEVDLAGGANTVKFEVVGRNSASTGYYFGLDCLSLSPVP